MRLRKFLKTVPMKLYALLLAVVLFSFFSNDFGLVDIQKTAIILAAGIDKTDDKFTLTAQIAVPKGSDRSQGGTSSVDISATGVTVSDCISVIFGKTGWVPKLVFCNLLVLGEEAVKEDVIGYLNYFLRNEYMPDSCLLAACAGKAEDLIASQSAIDDTSSLAIEKLFSDAAEKSGKALSVTLKDFAVSYYSVSKSGYLPFIRMEQQEGPHTAESSAPTGGGSEESVSREKVYTAEETAIFSEGKMVALLPREQTLAFSLLQGNVEAGTFTAQDKDKPVTVSVLENSGSVSLDMKGAPRAKLKVSVMARLCCRGTTAPMEDISSDSISEEVLQSAKETLDGYLQTLWKILKESGCDLFELKKSLYRSSLKKYREWKDYLLDAVEPEFLTEVKSTT